MRHACTVFIFLCVRLLRARDGCVGPHRCASDGAARAASLARASDLLQMGHVDAISNCAKSQALQFSRLGNRVPPGAESARWREVVSGPHRCASDGVARSVSLARASDLLQMGHVDAGSDCAKFQACARSRCGGRVPSGCACARWRLVVSGPIGAPPRARPAWSRGKPSSRVVPGSTLEVASWSARGNPVVPVNPSVL